VLEGRGEKLQDDIENMEEELDSDSPEYMEQLGKVFVHIQAPVRDEAEVEKSLRGKTHKDIEIEKKFSGDSELGEKAFGKLTDSVSNDDFGFFPQKSSSSGGDGNLLDVNLRLDKITTEINNFGRTKKQEVVVYRRDARLNDFKEGKLNFDNNPIYK